MEPLTGLILACCETQGTLREPWALEKPRRGCDDISIICRATPPLPAPILNGVLTHPKQLGDLDERLSLFMPQLDKLRCSVDNFPNDFQRTQKFLVDDPFARRRIRPSKFPRHGRSTTRLPQFPVYLAFLILVAVAQVVDVVAQNLPQPGTEIVRPLAHEALEPLAASMKDRCTRSEGDSLACKSVSSSELAIWSK